jgi:excisionase family DNA binding protein
VSKWEQAVKWCRRRPAQAAIIAALLFVELRTLPRSSRRRPDHRSLLVRAVRAAARGANSGMDVTGREAADMLGVSNKLVYKMFSSGKLQGHRAESRVVIYRDSVEAVIAAGRNGQAQTAAGGQQSGSGTARRKRRPAVKRLAASAATGFRFLP